MAPTIICAEEMKQVDGVTGGVKGINCLSMSNMSVLSSIHATFLATTCFRYRSQVFDGPALADIAESRSTNAGQLFDQEEQVKPRTVKRDHERGLGFQHNLAPFFGDNREDGNLLRGECHSILIRDRKPILVSCHDSSDDPLVVSHSTLIENKHAVSKTDYVVNIPHFTKKKGSNAITLELFHFYSIIKNVDQVNDLHTLNPNPIFASISSPVRWNHSVANLFAIPLKY